MPSFFASLPSLLVTTGREVMDDDVPSLAAAIAYSTLFALPPLLVMIVGIAGAVFGPDAVRVAILGQAGSLIGPGAEAALETMISNAGDLGTSVGAKLAGLVALLVGATSAFGQLQKALNRAWEVEPAPGTGLRDVIVKRVLSLGLVLTIAFLLLVSLAISAVLSAVGSAASALASQTLAAPLMAVVNVAVSLGVITLLFAVMFKVLPDARIGWRDVMVGAFATALLFTLGKGLLGLYLGRAEPGSAFGAAGSVVLILVWIYYSALILLVGAEFTQAWAVVKGAGIEPDAGAQRVGPEAVATPAAPATASPPAASDPPPADAGGFSIEDAASGRTRR